MTTGFVFPFRVDATGTIRPDDDEDAELRGKIVQVLFTAPGERVNQPAFGCGLGNLVFDPNNEILAAAVEFTAGQALSRWLGEELVVIDVGVRAVEETLTVELVYFRRRDRARRALRIQYS
ncbi:GPW/gp25 family protein [Nocardia bovistercoris]|uniref:GPW/gp25 family protein n=1 Tax=Nocardia bovistercoris TaxID=2785916 RepID=A0A931I8Y4_9NOCA|nr:GPW/gp25 family protein [Nocardia bovistercoris]MBH0775548.1 GPW/gp25 family protein [Nocardia bovistercoris]